MAARRWLNFQIKSTLREFVVDVELLSDDQTWRWASSSTKRCEKSHWSLRKLGCRSSFLNDYVHFSERLAFKTSEKANIIVEVLTFGCWGTLSTSLSLGWSAKASACHFGKERPKYSSYREYWNPTCIIVEKTEQILLIKSHKKLLYMRHASANMAMDSWKRQHVTE